MPCTAPSGGWKPEHPGTDPHPARRDAGVPGHAGGRGIVSGSRRHSRRSGNEHRRSQPGGLAGERGIPRGGARPLLLGPPHQVPDLDGPPRRATAQRARRHAPLAGRARPLHRQDRRDRLLHGRRLRADDGAASRAFRGERQLRRRHQRTWSAPCRTSVPSSAVTAPRIDGRECARFPIASSRCSLRRASSTTSRSIPMRDTASSTTTTPRSCRSGSKGSRSSWRPDYHEPSARDARRRIVDFFDIHLGS